MNESEGRKRLGAKVRAERMRMYRTVDAARIAARISRGAWDHVEQGDPVRDFTLGAIEEALGWPAGRAQQIIDGAGSDDIELAVEASSLGEATKAAIRQILAEDREREKQQGRGSA